MVSFIFTEDAKRAFLKMPKNIQDRIINKLKELKSHGDIFSVLKRLTHSEFATHRLRIGSYRLILQLKNHDEKIIEFIVLDIGHRKDIYR